jgi:squalene-associated FAD-dependent desaturase
MSQPVIIVGGGLAGLAAATALALNGRRCIILESRPRWGGRASSLIDSATGEAIDNCQHVTMGCCTNFAHWRKTVGVESVFRTEKTLYFIGPDGRCDRFSATAGPAPLHLAAAFAGLRFLNWSDKFRLAMGLRALANRKWAAATNEPFASWLTRHGQPRSVCDLFWHTVIVSALSESLDRVHVAAARKVFVDGFMAVRHGWEVSVPVRPLDEMYGPALMEWFRSRGVETRLQSGVSRVRITNSRVTGVQLRGGEELSADRVVLATPNHLLPSLLPDDVATQPPFGEAARLEHAPISSVHVWFDREISPLPHATLIGRTSQWMFNRSAIHAPGDSPPAASNWYYQVVISASRNVQARSTSDVIDKVVEELRAVFPAAREATVIRSRLITEHRAALSMLPGVEENRPSQRTPVSGLYLAGCWTQTGWPSTMEGAVRGGYLAAEAILADENTPAACVQPDSNPEWLARMTLGL